MGYNKFQKYDGTVLLDLTQDTVTESDVLEGGTFHKADGEGGVGALVADSDPLKATDDSTMGALLTSDNAGKIAQFNGTSDTYIDGGYYLIETVIPEGFAITINDSGGYGPGIDIYLSDSTTFNEYAEYKTGNIFTIYTTNKYIRVEPAGEIVSYDGGVTLVSRGVFEISGDATIYMSTMCLTGDTEVTMADYSKKRIDEIEIDDYILSYDWRTMQLLPNRVIYTDKDMNKTHTEYDVWTFDDGSVVKTVHRHRFFNVERKAFVYMDEWNLGERTFKIDGTMPALVSHEVVTETVNHYKISGEFGTNYFANNLLTGDRYCPVNIVFAETV